LTGREEEGGETWLVEKEGALRQAEEGEINDVKKGG